MPITWDEKTMGTGVAQIDAQHKELFRRFNAFHDALSKGQAVSQLVPTLDFMTKYAESHFRGEEGLMAVHKCPTAAANKVAHAEFIKTIANLKRQVENGGLTASAAIQVERTLTAWLRTHICTIDVKLRDTTACQKRAS